MPRACPTALLGHHARTGSWLGSQPTPTRLGSSRSAATRDGVAEHPPGPITSEKDPSAEAPGARPCDDAAMSLRAAQAGSLRRPR